MQSSLPNASWLRSIYCTLVIWLILLVVPATAQPSLGNGIPAKGIETGTPKSPAAIPVYTLRDCLKIAKEKQPKLIAVRASLASAEKAQLGIEDTRFLGHVIIPDLKYRRQQAVKGIEAGQAELLQAEQEVTQAVVWTYYTIVYAKEQQKALKELIDLIQIYRDQADKIVNSKEGPGRDINQSTLDSLNIALATAKSKAITAESGVERGKAALLEAMGLSENDDFNIPNDSLPEIDAKLDRKQLIDLALARRGEVMLASIASEVTRLEVFAQWSIRLRLRTNTYTLTADIHHTLIPGGSKDGEYRPDAIAPEMPPHLVGNRENRTAKIQDLSIRADAVLEKTRNLVVLETKNAFTVWDEWTKKAALAQNEQVKASKNLLTRLRKVADVEGFKGVTVENVIKAQAAYTEALAAFNEARFQQIVSLASLERITGGGIIVNYPGR